MEETFYGHSEIFRSSDKFIVRDIAPNGKELKGSELFNSHTAALENVADSLKLYGGTKVLVKDWPGGVIKIFRLNDAGEIKIEIGKSLYPNENKGDGV